MTLEEIHAAIIAHAQFYNLGNYQVYSLAEINQELNFSLNYSAPLQIQRQCDALAVVAL